MNQPWQYRSANYDENNIGFYINHHDEIHRITVGESGELTSHEIGKSLVIRATDREVDFKRLYSKKYYEHAVHWVTNQVNLYTTKHDFFKLIYLNLKSIKYQLQMYLSK